MNHHLFTFPSSRARFALFSAIFSLVFISLGAYAGGGKKKDKWTPPADQWVGYFVLKKGKMKPVELPIEANKDKDWVITRYTNYLGLKPRVAVLEVINETGKNTSSISLSTTNDSGQTVRQEVNFDTEVPVAAIHELLASSMSGSNRFTLVDRTSDEQLLKELEFSNSDKVLQASASKKGQLLGPQFIVILTINEWSPNKKTMGALGVGGKQIAEVALSVKIIEVESGEVLKSMTERAKSGSWNFGIGAGLGFDGVVGIGGTSPINYAVSAAINKVVYRLCLFIKDVSWKGSVMEAKASNLIYINGSAQHGLEVGQELDVFAQGEELIDPETGQVRGAEEELIGTLIISQLKPEYAIARVKEGCQGIKRGDRVRAR